MVEFYTTKITTREHQWYKKNIPNTPIKDYYLETEASKLYDKIRNNKLDIEKISENLNINKKNIERIKNHIFRNQHKLDNGIDKFRPDKNIAEAWQRLYEGNFYQSDLVWFMHELAESILEQAFKEKPLREIHNYVNKTHNWAKTFSK